MNTLSEPIVSESPRRQIDEMETLSSGLATPGERSSGTAFAGGLGIQRSWSCRKVDISSGVEIKELPSTTPSPGDLALVRVETMGFHKHLTTSENRRLRLYPGVQFVGVFGNRYASDAFEAEVDGIENVSLLTGAGMIGTVKSKYGNMDDGTRLSVLGFLRRAKGERLNLKNQLFRPATERKLPKNLVYIVGSSMNSGKTTTCTRLIRALSNLGMKVAACKLTGSVSNHDPDELAAAAACKVTDFSDHGFASTYLSSKAELLELFHAMLADVAAVSPDVVLMELADGLLQRETMMLLADPEIRKAHKGVVLTAGGSLSALYGANHLRELGYRVIAVSGKFTSSPLAMREYRQNDSDIPVVSSLNLADSPMNTGLELGRAVSEFLKNE